jgi:hypothetical protein
MAASDVKELYEQCGRRIVAVENKHSSQDEKHRYAKEIADEVLKMGGYYSQDIYRIFIFISNVRFFCHYYYCMLQESFITKQSLKLFNDSLLFFGGSSWLKYD